MVLYDPKIGFHRSTGGGALTPIANGLPTGLTQGWPSMRFGIATDPVRSGVVVAGVCGSSTTAGTRGFWFSSDRGQTFTLRTGLDCVQAVAVGAPLPGGGPSTLYALGRQLPAETGQRLYWSTDDGVTWHRMAQTGLLTKTLTGLEADPVVAGRIYVTTSGRGIHTGQVTL